MTTAIQSAESPRPIPSAAAQFDSADPKNFPSSFPLLFSELPNAGISGKTSGIADKKIKPNSKVGFSSTAFILYHISSFKTRKFYNF